LDPKFTFREGADCDAVKKITDSRMKELAHSTRIAWDLQKAKDKSRNAPANVGLTGSRKRRADSRGQAVGYLAKSTLPVPREKCGCALCAATRSNLQIGLRFVLSFQVTIVENI
jgi:hypothetical protein